MKDYKIYLQHILDEISYLQQDSNGLKFNDFMKNETLKRSFVRSIEVIGEAVKNLPDDIRQKNNSIPWKNIAGMRDKLIHHYFGIDYKMVWDVVLNKIPELKNAVEKMLTDK
ncbi:MAG: DUF86 domain-containing protein [Candidatus Thorarchaeota archaeon]